MEGLRTTDFVEVEVTKIGIKIEGATKADVVNCAGKLSEEMNNRTMQKKCGKRIIKQRTKGTGDGTVKASLFVPYDLFAGLYGMKQTGLKDNVIAYGTSSLHAVACITAEVINEDGEKKLKAYPNATIQTALSREIDNDSEDIVMSELEFAVTPDEAGNGLYELVLNDSTDATLKSKWMESFTPELVKVESA